nr:IclR family transcriptional regulator [Clostridium sp. MCC353]
MNNESQHQDVINSVIKTFKVLEIISKEGKISVTELVKKSGMTKTTVLRILATLKQCRAVKQETDTKLYCLDIFLYSLGMKVLNVFSPIDQIKVIVEEFTKEESRDGLLVQVDGDHLVYLERFKHNDLYRVVSTPGTRAPLMSTSSGMAILAFLPDERIRRVYESNRLLIDNDTYFENFEELEAEVEKIRRNGYYLDWERHRKGICSVSIPVYHPNGSVFYSLSFPQLVSQTDRHELMIFAQRAKKLSDMLREPFETREN